MSTVLYVLEQVLDITIITVAVYWILMLFKDNRAMNLVKGIIFLLILYVISGLLSLTTVHFLLEKSWVVLAIAVAIIFQPELRSILERLGTAGSVTLVAPSARSYEEQIRILTTSIFSAAHTKTGMLIVIEGNTNLGSYIETGVPIDGRLTPELIGNIFYNHAPLHDGAMIIRDKRIMAASCIMPLTDNDSLDNQLGTRHRAALGISETADCFVIVVSEETGGISVAKKGKLYRNIDRQTFDALIRDFYDFGGGRKGRRKKPEEGK